MTRFNMTKIWKQTRSNRLCAKTYPHGKAWQRVLVGAVLAIAAALAPAGEAAADPVRPFEVFATGLDNPRGLTFARGHRLLVAEAGRGGSNSTVGLCEQVPPPTGPFTGGPTGRVSMINRHGVRSTVSDGLASGQTTPMTGSDVVGPEEVVFMDGEPYVVIQGGGCSTGNPDQPRGIYRIENDGTPTLIADLGAWFAANPTEGPQDDDRAPDGVPTDVVVVGDSFYVLEGNHAQLVKVELDGTITRIADLSLIGHLTYTALDRGPDGNFYVATFGELPYPDGGSQLFRITPDGEITHLLGGLTTVIDIRFDRAGRLYLLEASTGNTPTPPFLVSGSGRVLRLTDEGLEVITQGLTFPAGMAFSPRGDLYVSNYGFGSGPQGGLGEIVRIDLRRPRGH
jgi:hypothetical protein